MVSANSLNQTLAKKKKKKRRKQFENGDNKPEVENGESKPETENGTIESTVNGANDLVTFKIIF